MGVEFDLSVFHSCFSSGDAATHVNDGSSANQLTGFGFVDSIGALGLIYFSYSEGKESFEKAADMEDDSVDDGVEKPN